MTREPKPPTTGAPRCGISVRYGEPHGKLGHYDERTGEIVINPKQPHVGVHITLMHELLHAVDASMVVAGVRKRRVDHDWIENAAMNLLLILVDCGLYSGVTKREMFRFYRMYRAAGSAK